MEHCRRYKEDKGLIIIQENINSFSDEVNDRISRLDQTVRDLMQFVSTLAVLCGALTRLILVRSLRGSQSMRLIDQPALQQA